MLVLGGTCDGRIVDWVPQQRGEAMQVPVLQKRGASDPDSIQFFHREVYHVERLMAEGTPHWFLVHSDLRGSGSDGGISATEIIRVLASGYRKPTS